MFLSHVRRVCGCAGVFDGTDNSTICLGNIENLNVSVYSPVFIIVTLSLKSRLRDTIEELRRSLQPKESALEALQQSQLEKDQVCIPLKMMKFGIQNFAFAEYRTPCIFMCKGMWKNIPYIYVSVHGCFACILWLLFLFACTSAYTTSLLRFNFNYINYLIKSKILGDFISKLLMMTTKSQ